MFEQIRQFLRDNPRLPLIIGVATLTGLLVVWGVWGGFSLDFSRFYAAEPTECETPSPGTHTASVLTGQCGTTQNVLSWNLPPGNDANSILRGVDGGNAVFVTLPNFSCHGLTTYTDTDIQPGSTYTYRHKAFADRTSNSVICPPPTPVPTPTLTPTPGVTPTTSPGVTPTPPLTPTPTAIPTFIPTQTPSPVPTPTQTFDPATPTPDPSETPLAQQGAGLFCSPETQTIFLGQIAFFNAIGGDGAYRWEGGAGSQQEDDEGAAGSAAFSYVAQGTKTVTVRSADQSATCLVTVLGTTPTPTPTPTGPIVVIKQARNVTAGQTAAREEVIVSSGQRIEFTVRVTDREGDGTPEVFVRDTLPPGMSYMSGTTTIDGEPASDDIVTGQVAIGALPPRGQRLVRWSALADRMGELPVGRRIVQPEAAAETTEDGESFMRVDGVTLTLIGTGTGSGGPLGGAGVPATGPGGATLLAFVLAAVSSLLYAAYTRSPGFRRRELRQLGDDQGPMDFRN